MDWTAFAPLAGAVAVGAVLGAWMGASWLSRQTMRRVLDGIGLAAIALSLDDVFLGDGTSSLGHLCPKPSHTPQPHEGPHDSHRGALGGNHADAIGWNDHSCPRSTQSRPSNSNEEVEQAFDKNRNNLFAQARVAAGRTSRHLSLMLYEDQSDDEKAQDDEEQDVVEPRGLNAQAGPRSGPARRYQIHGAVSLFVTGFER